MPENDKLVIPDEIIIPDAKKVEDEVIIKDNVIVDETKATIDDVEYTINASGEAIDAEGVVIFDKATVDEKIKAANASTEEDDEVETEVNIDEVVYKLDENGNALAEDGTVFKTKEELDALATDDEAPLIDAIQSKVGISILDDKGQPITYEDTEDGVVNYITDAVELRSNERYIEESNKFFEQNPDILELYKYKQIHGSIENYTPDVDYSKIVLKQDDANNEQVQIDILKSARIAKGDNAEEANRFVQYSKTDGKLFEDATNAKKYLVDGKVAKDAAVNQQLKANADANKLAEQQAMDNVHNKIVKEGKLIVNDKTYTLPKNIRIKTGDGKYETKTQADFFEYIYKPVPIKLDDGTSVVMPKYQYDLDIEENSKTIDEDLFNAYLKFVGGDTTQIVEQQVKAAEVRKLRTLRSKSFTTSSKVNTSPTKVDKIKLPVN